MESILITQSYVLPGTEKIIEISYLVDLNTLDEKEFLELCTTDSKCTDNVWDYQFVKKFGMKFKQYKPSDYTWKQYYLYLNDWLNNGTSEQFNQTKREDLQLLQSLFIFNSNIKGANWAAKNGYLNILKWLSQKNPPILPGDNGANWAAVNGYLDILEWMSRQNPPILPNIMLLTF